MLRVVLSLLALAIGLATLPLPTLADGTVVTLPVRNGQTDFSTPSQNVECLYTPAGGVPHYTPPGGQAEISCDRLAPSYLRVSLLEQGPVKVEKHVTDQTCCAIDNILAYGQSVALGPFVCDSAPTGLTCRRGKAGFRISKAGVKRW